MVAALAAGKIGPDECGPIISDFVPSGLEKPTNFNDSLNGVVITIDNFGNLITNIDAIDVAQFQAPIVEPGGHNIRMVKTYGDVRPGDFLGLINSFGVLEIARSEQRECLQKNWSQSRGSSQSEGKCVSLASGFDSP